MVFLVLSLWMASSGHSQTKRMGATPVRGRVLAYSDFYQRHVPVAGAKVRISRWVDYISDRSAAAPTFITDSNGFFVTVLPEGIYAIGVTARQGSAEFRIRVIPIDQRRYQYQDIPVIVLQGSR
jgi:hypothetical protein